MFQNTQRRKVDASTGIFSSSSSWRMSISLKGPNAEGELKVESVLPPQNTHTHTHTHTHTLSLSLSLHLLTLWAWPLSRLPRVTYLHDSVPMKSNCFKILVFCTDLMRISPTSDWNLNNRGALFIYSTDWIVSTCCARCSTGSSEECNVNKTSLSSVLLRFTF